MNKFTIYIFQNLKVQNYQNYEKLSQNVKLHTGVYGNRFYDFTYTLTSVFNFLKNHFLKMAFYEILKHHDFENVMNFGKCEILSNP